MKRPPTLPADLASLQAARPEPSDPPKALVEAYKKHVDELRGIEDRQNKMIALLLGIFSAAATLLTKGWLNAGTAQKAYVTLIAVVLIWIGQHAVNEFHALRIAVRELLVRCEIALRFYETNVFITGSMLYTKDEIEYHTKGGWLKQYYLLVWAVGAAFIVILWFGKHM